MSLLFFKRVLANPLRVGYVVPSSPFLTRQTARRIDFSQPRVVVELGPGEGCHTRQIVKRMNPDSRLILFELDEEFVSHLRKQFFRDPRVTVLNTDALHLPETLRELGHPHCDYIVSGLPFFVIEPKTKDKLLRRFMTRSEGTVLEAVPYFEGSRIPLRHLLCEDGDSFSHRGLVHGETQPDAFVAMPPVFRADAEIVAGNNEDAALLEAGVKCFRRNLHPAKP